MISLMKGRTMKKIIKVILVMSLILSLLIGCGKQSIMDLTTKEILKQSREQSKNLKNLEYTSTISVDFSGSEKMGISNPINITTSGQMKDAKNFKMDMSADSGKGFKVEGSIYRQNDEMLLYFPMLSAFIQAEYIRFNISEVFDQTMNMPSPSNLDKDKLLEIMNRFKEKSSMDIYSIFRFSDKKEEVLTSINGEDKKLVKIDASIDASKLVDYGLEFMLFAMEDEESKKIFFRNITDEKLNEIKNLMTNPEKRAEINKALEDVKNSTISLVLYFDNECYLNRMKVDSNVNFKDVNNGLDMYIKLTASVDYFNIGMVKEINIPDISEDKVKDFKDLIPNN